MIVRHREMSCPPLHPSLQDDGGTDFVHQCLVLTSLAPYATVQHGPVCQHAGITFVPPLHRDIGESNGQLIDKSLDARQILAVQAICLFGQAHHKPLYGFLGNIFPQEFHQGSGLHRSQPPGDDLTRVSNRQAGALFAVINTQYASHQLLLIQYPGVGIGGAHIVASLHGSALVIMCGQHYTIHV